jgi:hypothetical protein
LVDAPSRPAAAVNCSRGTVRGTVASIDGRCTDASAMIIAART